MLSKSTSADTGTEGAAVLRRKALRVAQTAERKRHTAMKNSVQRRSVRTSATTGELERSHVKVVVAKQVHLMSDSLSLETSLKGDSSWNIGK